ncbi:MAG: alpha/beta hydrolase [Solirubrobacterales bacterium]|nr:alpha/beta hydrolase [Solirubrobacterales bacterium]
MRIRAILGLVAGVALLLGVGEARAAAPFSSCFRGTPVECATLTVPVDRAGAAPGTVPLHVVRYRAAHATRPPLMLVTGGPGQSGTGLVLDALPGGVFPANRLHRDVIAFDPRGTGESGVLRCPALEKAIVGLDTDAAASACWSSLGAARYDYTSRTVADDIESIRQAVGAPTLALYGISYGTSEVQTYARVYPQSVDRLILDSTVPPGGGDGLERQSFAAIPRVLRAVCPGRRCAGITTDPVADLATLIHSLPAGGLVGRVVNDRGHRVRQRAGRYDLFDLLVNGDFDPTLRGSLPAAVHSALGGDPAPLLRLVRASLESDKQNFNSPRLLSTADFAATICEETAFPWSRTASVDERRSAVAAAAAATPAASIAPFDNATLLAPQIVAPCVTWPTSAQPPDLGSANPNVPVLVLSGEADLRTPTEGAQAVAAGFPQAIVRTFPYAGHDVIDGVAGQPCAAPEARAFLAGAPVGTCPGHQAAPSVAPIAPRSLHDVAPLSHPGGTAGRVLHAVGLTIDDYFLSPGNPVVPGLRSGRVSVVRNGLRFVKDVYVPGVTLSGNLTPKQGRFGGTLRVSGALRGTLRVVRNRISGRLGAHSVHARIRVTTNHVVALPAASVAGPFVLPASVVRPAYRLRLPRPR